MKRKELWYQLTNKDQAGVALVALANKYKERSTSRKTRATNLLSVYEGLSLGRFSAEAYDSAAPLEFTDDSDLSDEGSRSDVTWNLAASILDSVDAKLFALDKVKTAFVVTDGGWEAQRASVMAGRFVEGQMTEPQGIFPDLWAAWRHGARLAMTATGSCAMFFWSDPDEGKVIAELDDTLDVFVDSSGLPYDGLASIGRITYWDPERLAAKFPKHEAAIYAIAEKPDSQLQYLNNDDGDTPDEVRRVPLVQGWRMKAPGIKGRYMAAIPGAVLEEGEYLHDYPPCVFFTPYRQLAGFWGRSLLERIVKPLQRMNEILTSVDDAERLTPKGVLWYDPLNTPKEFLETIKNVMCIPHTGPMDRKGIYEPPAPFNPLVLELLKLHKDACFDLSGMSEAQTTASRERGLSSGVAIRLVQNQVYERFAPVEDEFTRAVGPASTQQIMRCAKEIHDRKGKFTAVWKGAGDNGFLQEIPSDVFDILDKYKYKSEAQATSGDQNTPADRVQLAEELMQAGIITGEAYASILQHFDVHGEAGTSFSNVEQQFMDQQIDFWLYAEVDDAQAKFTPPEKWMNSQTLLLRTGAAYISAKMAMLSDINEPEVTTRLGFFHKFMAALEQHIEQKEAAAMAAQQQQQPAQQLPPAA